MAYTTTAEIQLDIKGMVFSSTTIVTDTAVTGFIAEADALINAHVGKRYDTPVTGSGEGLTLLKLCSRSLVSARVKGIMAVKQDKSQDANQAVVSTSLSPTAVMKILCDIKDGVLNLDGATPKESDYGFKNNNVTNLVCPVIKKDEPQW